MYRALYIYDIAEIHAVLGQLITEFLWSKPDLRRSHNTKELTKLWFRHHLDRLLYIHIVPDPLDSVRDSDFHNEFLIGQPELTKRFYNLIRFSPHLFPEDPCFVRLTDRKMILEFLVGPDHASRLA